MGTVIKNSQKIHFHLTSAYLALYSLTKSMRTDQIFDLKILLRKSHQWNGQQFFANESMKLFAKKDTEQISDLSPINHFFGV